MLDIKYIRENPEGIKEGVAAKQYDPTIVDDVLKLDEERRGLLQEIELLRAERNKAAKARDIEEGKRIKKELQEKEPKLKQTDEEFNKALRLIPNPPSKDVITGKDETENEIIRKWGEPKDFNFNPKPFWELGEDLDIIDTKRAAKVSGTRFFYLKGDGVLLDQAVVSYALEALTSEGFVPIIPPVMITRESMAGMGYLEHGGDEDMYVLDKDDMIMVGTSEQSIGPMHKDETLSPKDLPIRYVSYSTCFRREAGSYGKDTKGAFRVHQFNKVEMFCFVKPEESDKEHEYLLELEERMLQGLEIPYEVSRMCSGDLGMPAARKYDLNGWFPHQKKYRELTSTSTTTDFQARRLNIKSGGEFVHTLNGTAFSQRPILAILENYQQADGSVNVPKVLQKWVGKEKITPKK